MLNWLKNDFEDLYSMQFMSISWLASLRRNALRRRVWFHVLSKVERSVVNLTVRYVDQIRSLKLSLAIGRVVCKLLEAFKGRFLKRVERVGSDIAEKISKIAISWCYVEASSWKHDLSFIRFLGVDAINNNPGRRYS